MSPLIFSLLGILGKVGAFLITNWLESRKQDKANEHAFRLAALKIENQPHAPGFDAAHDFTRGTRRILGLLLIFTVCAIQVFCVWNAERVFGIPIAKDGGFFGWLFGGSAETTLQVSLGWVALKIVDIQAMCAGFYFTPVGSSNSR